MILRDDSLIPVFNKHNNQIHNSKGFQLRGAFLFLLLYKIQKTNLLKRSNPLLHLIGLQNIVFLQRQKACI